MAAVAVPIVAAGGFAAFGLSRSAAQVEDVESGPPSTAQVQQLTLELTDETSATLEFVSSATVSSPVEGTVTSVASEGDVVEAGTILATLDGDPVVALYGDLPTWRDLDTSSDDGADVYQLELNLVTLGFDPDGEIEIDEEFDSATADAVERWQESLGLEATGEVTQAMVVFVPGRILVDQVSVAVGSGIPGGTAILSGRVLERWFAVPTTSEANGSLTELASPGRAVTTGTVLFVDGGYPVVAIEGDVAAMPLLERDLEVGVANGADVKALEELLSSLGFDGGGALTVDDEFDDATADALAEWYASLGLQPEDSGVLPAGGFVVVPSGLEVGTVLVQSGTDPGRETPAVVLSSPARIVSTSAPLGDDTFAVDAPVEVEYPDGSVATAVVSDVGTVATNDSGQPGAQATVPITIEVDDIPDSVAGFVEVPVTLRVVTESIPDAFVVPVTALLALAEGGYALEVVDGPDATHLIPIEPGVFVNGFVEVTGADLVDGLEVVVAS
ncbi:MAG: peptidoglycan-binding protein [Acidimicrobiia bacterium]|nr:peptidoglycan-binding protein [Acidimicrobiia bacterium]